RSLSTDDRSGADHPPFGAPPRPILDRARVDFAARSNLIHAFGHWQRPRHRNRHGFEASVGRSRSRLRADRPPRSAPRRRTPERLLGGEAPGGPSAKGRHGGGRWGLHWAAPDEAKEARMAARKKASRKKAA